MLHLEVPLSVVLLALLLSARTHLLRLPMEATRSIENVNAIDYLVSLPERSNIYHDLRLPSNLAQSNIRRLYFRRLHQSNLNLSIRHPLTETGF